MVLIRISFYRNRKVVDYSQFQESDDAGKFCDFCKLSRTSETITSLYTFFYHAFGVSFIYFLFLDYLCI